MSAALDDDIADIDATIRYWRTRGIGVAQIARQLRCANDWRAVRREMIRQITQDAAAELRRAA